MSLSQQYKVLLAQELRSLFKHSNLPRHVAMYSGVDVVGMSSDEIRKMYFVVKEYRSGLHSAQEGRLCMRLQKVEDAALLVLGSLTNV